MANESVISKIVNTYLKREEETKLKDLFKFFCNHVFLGQWELAKTAIPKLANELKDSDSKIDIIDFLCDVAEFPFPQR